MCARLSVSVREFMYVSVCVCASVCVCVCVCVFRIKSMEVVILGPVKFFFIQFY